MFHPCPQGLWAAASFISFYIITRVASCCAEQATGAPSCVFYRTKCSSVWSKSLSQCLLLLLYQKIINHVFKKIYVPPLEPHGNITVMYVYILTQMPRWAAGGGRGVSKTVSCRPLCNMNVVTQFHNDPANKSGVAKKPLKCYCLKSFMSNF